MDNNPAAQFNPEAFLTDAMEGFDMSQIANAAYGSDTALSTTSANTSSVQLSDFTKRKNWPIRILSELKDFHHVVSPTGKFLFCSPSCQEMVGFSPQELVGLSVANFIHVDDVDSFISNFNLALSQNSFSMFYRFRKRDDKFILLEVNGHPYTPEGSTTPNCFFITARPYPSKSASMLDSFLELRIENEILTWKLKELRREAEENHVSNDNFLRPEFIPKKTLTDVETSSLVPSSASASTTLNSAPVELDILKAKRKKSKVAEGIHVCTDCGTVDSPEWRKGPHGPKTLCNACGLRYTKKSRKANEAAAETNN